MQHKLNTNEQAITIDSTEVALEAILGLPKTVSGLIIFAHGSGSGRFSPRNNFVAKILQEAKFGTLLLDLLTEEEALDRRNVFDIALLARRLNLAKNWLMQKPEFIKTPIGFFGASTGAGAAILAIAEDPKQVFAMVSRGGRPDLAGAALSLINVPTLLLVGGNDGMVIDLNQQALEQMHCIKAIELIPGATHLFEEEGTLEEVAKLATEWFIKMLPK